MSSAQPNGRLANVSDQIAKNRFWLGVAMWAVGVGITVLAGYTSVTLTRGADAQRLTTAEYKITDLQRQLDLKSVEIQRQMDRDRDNNVTRQELARYIEGQNQLLSEILRQVSEQRRTGR